MGGMGNTNVKEGNNAVLVSEYGLFDGAIFCLSGFPQPDNLFITLRLWRVYKIFHRSLADDFRNASEIMLIGVIQRLMMHLKTISNSQHMVLSTFFYLSSNNQHMVLSTYFYRHISQAQLML